MVEVSPLALALAQQISGVRRSDNIDDRRKEHFGSFPQSPQMPNVFDGGDMTMLDWKSDFLPVPSASRLSDDAGANILQGRINQYLAERQSPMFGSLPSFALNR